MEPNTKNDYNPADDDNQGVVQLMAQGGEAAPGVPQDGGVGPFRNQGPELEKAEVADGGNEPSDTDSNGVNDDLLAEEDVETGDAAETDSDQ